MWNNFAKDKKTFHRKSINGDFFFSRCIQNRLVYHCLRAGNKSALIGRHAFLSTDMLEKFRIYWPRADNRHRNVAAQLPEKSPGKAEDIRFCGRVHGKLRLGDKSGSGCHHDNMALLPHIRQKKPGNLRQGPAVQIYHSGTVPG